MKKIIDYYSIITLLLFIIYNFFLRDLIVGGILYQVIMSLLIILNIIITILYKDRIKKINGISIAYIFIWLFSKNAFQAFFAFSNIFVLYVNTYKNNKYIFILLMLLLIPISFSYIIAFGDDLNEEKSRSLIYPDMHYYCDNNYEVYSYSGGALDKFHYNIGKYYPVIDKKDILYISYNPGKEVSEKKYNKFLKEHKCWLDEDFYGVNVRRKEN